jgi:hypothetical protein
MSANSEDVGSVRLALQLASGTSFATASYAITGPGTFDKAGTIDIANTTTVSAVVGGIPAGVGYLLGLTATSTDGAIQCGGSASFDVRARTTTAATVSLSCHETPGTGSVAVSGSLNICPIVDSLSASPSEVIVGFPVLLSVVAHDRDNGPSPLAYSWEVSSGGLSGALNDASAASPTFTCFVSGTATVTVIVSDGDPAPGCADSATVSIVCTDPPPGPDPSLQTADVGDPNGCSHGTDTLQEYAQQCTAAMGGVSLDDFDCEDNGVNSPYGSAATEVPRQAGVPCNAPNVLNARCDPGSKFHVLHRDNGGDGIYIVAHCRKKGHSLNDGLFGDIAVIEYNKRSGATCFYQALGSSLDGHVLAPAKGVYPWMTPFATQRAQCVGCHDNGPFVRSPYLAQLGEVWPASMANPDSNYLPGTLASDEQSWNGAGMPYSFVGLDFQVWQSYSVTSSNARICTSCHRMGIAEHGSAFATIGTALHYGILATDKTQASKVMHGVDQPGISSPIWMTPGSTDYNQSNSDAAHAIAQCANQFMTGGGPSSDCVVTRFARGNTCMSNGSCPQPPSQSLLKVGMNKTSSAPFVTSDGWVYFRGTDDKLWKVSVCGTGQLWIGSNHTKSTPFVTSDGWVWFQGTDDKLWKVFIDGTQLSQPGNNSTSSSAAVVGDWVYFRGTDSKLWRMKTDGSAQNQISNNTASSTPFVTPDGWAYFQGTDNNLWKVQGDGTGQLQIGGNTAKSAPFVTSDGWVWFQGTDDKLWKVFNDGTQLSQPGNNKTAASPIVVGQWVYFRGTDDKLWQMSTDGMVQTNLGGNTTASTPAGTGDAVYFEGTNQVLWRYVL